MAPKLDGGPAFPRMREGRTVDADGMERSNPLTDGMSLRDYFAAQALIGFMADGTARGRLNVTGDQMAAVVAKACYQAADAMLAERQK